MLCDRSRHEQRLVYEKIMSYIEVFTGSGCLRKQCLGSHYWTLIDAISRTLIVHCVNLSATKQSTLLVNV